MYEDEFDVGDRVSFANIPLGRPFDGMLSCTLTKKSLVRMTGKKFAATLDSGDLVEAR